MKIDKCQFENAKAKTAKSLAALTNRSNITAV